MKKQTSKDNQERAERAKTALLKYMELDPLSLPANILDECTLSDFLADALHLFGRSEVRKALTRAERHYTAELKENTND